MTLDEAQGAFESDPSEDSAADLLETGAEYLTDEMIESTTFTVECVAPVVMWLRQHKGD